MQKWKKTLKSILEDQRLHQAVRDLFAEQNRFITGSRLGVRSKLWFAIDEGRPVGPVLARLLEEIDRRGSVIAAVRSVRISYHHAWSLISEAEKNLGRKLVEPCVGRSHGGRSELSADGRKLLEIFRQVNSEAFGSTDDYSSPSFDSETDVE